MIQCEELTKLVSSTTMSQEYEEAKVKRSKEGEKKQSSSTTTIPFSFGGRSFSWMPPFSVLWCAFCFISVHLASEEEIWQGASQL